MKSHLYMAAAMIALFPVQSHAAVTVYTATLTQMTQPVARLQITRNGTTFALYAGSSQGGMKFLGSFVSAGLNPDRLVITAATTGVPPSIFGLDYVRRIDGVNPTV